MSAVSLLMIITLWAAQAKDSPPGTEHKRCVQLAKKADKERKALIRKQTKLRAPPMLKLAKTVRKFFKSLSQEDRTTIRAYRDALKKYRERENAARKDPALTERTDEYRRWLRKDLDSKTRKALIDSGYGIELKVEARKTLIDYAASLQLPSLAKEVDRIYTEKLFPVMNRTNKASCSYTSRPPQMLEVFFDVRVPYAEITGPVDLPSTPPKNYDLFTCPGFKVDHAALITVSDRDVIYDFPEHALYGPSDDLEFRVVDKRFRVTNDFDYASDNRDISEWGPVIHGISLGESLSEQLKSVSDKNVIKMIKRELEDESHNFYGYWSTPTEDKYHSMNCGELLGR